jgi:hypothetical protein
MQFWKQNKINGVGWRLVILSCTQRSLVRITLPPAMAMLLLWLGPSTTPKFEG